MFERVTTLFIYIDNYYMDETLSWKMAEYTLKGYFDQSASKLL